MRVDKSETTASIEFLRKYKQLNYEEKLNLISGKVFLNRDEWLKREYLDLIIRLLNDTRFQKVFTQQLKIPDLFLFIQIYSLSIKYKSDLNKVLQEETSFQWCISCGCCTASCSAGNHTTFNVRRISLLLRRGEIESLEKELEKCMLCGKCTLVCPREIQLRNVVMSIKKNILKYKMTAL